MRLEPDALPAVGEREHPARFETTPEGKVVKEHMGESLIDRGGCELATEGRPRDREKAVLGDMRFLGPGGFLGRRSIGGSLVFSSISRRSLLARRADDLRAKRGKISFYSSLKSRLEPNRHLTYDIFIFLGYSYMHACGCAYPPSVP